MGEAERGRETERVCVAWPKCKYRTEQQWQVKPTQDGHKHLHRCSEIPILHIFFLFPFLPLCLSVSLRLDNAPMVICMEICFCAIRRYQFICDTSALGARWTNCQRALRHITYTPRLTIYKMTSVELSCWHISRCI